MTSEIKPSYDLKPQDLMGTEEQRAARDQEEALRIVSSINKAIEDVVRKNYGNRWRGESLMIPAILFGDDLHLIPRVINKLNQNGWEVTPGNRIGSMDERFDPWYDIKPRANVHALRVTDDRFLK